ncbi:MAG: S-layer homology domain-containing protein [Clostridia bacterium]|nr:S-layer homology domain-containing protein [Clostridia bacterium]
MYNRVWEEYAADGNCQANAYTPNNPNNGGGNGNGGGGSNPNFANPVYIIDPSGYVYEAVPENRLEGVKATVLNKHQDRSWIAWDAEWFGQENPLITDKEGRYAWDVPEGDWKVAFEKEGDEPAESWTMHVPPVHTDVNIGMKSTEAPKVSGVTAYMPESSNGYIEVGFDKYIKSSTISSSTIQVFKEGTDEEIQGTFTAVDPYEYEENKFIAKKVRFIPSSPLSPDSGYHVKVTQMVQSYADRFVSQEYKGNAVAYIPVSGVSIMKDKVDVTIGDSFSIAAEIKPLNATNKAVTWTSSSSDVADVNAQGMVNAKSEGTAVITVKTMDGQKTASCTVNVQKKKETGGGTANGGTTNGGTTTTPNSDEKDIIEKPKEKIPGSTPDTKPEDKSKESMDKKQEFNPNETSFIVGKNALNIEAFNGNLILRFSEGTFEKDTVIVVKKCPYTEEIRTKTAVSSVISGETVYEIDTKDAKPLKPVHINLKFENEKFKNVDSRKIGIYRLSSSQNSKWEYSGGVIDRENSLLSIWIGGSGRFKAAASVTAFEDMKNHWARDSIEVLASRSMISGMGNGLYKPEMNITRAQMAKMISGALDANTAKTFYEQGKNSGTKTIFTDVAENSPYNAYIQRVAKLKIMTGYNGKFRPNDIITREEIAAIAIRMLDDKQTIDKAALGKLFYKDIQKVSTWALGYLNLAEQRGLMKGYKNGDFKPAEGVTRGEAAVVMYRLLEQQGFMVKPVTVKGILTLSKDTSYELLMKKDQKDGIYMIIPVHSFLKEELDNALKKEVELTGIPEDHKDPAEKKATLKVYSIGNMIILPCNCAQ